MCAGDDGTDFELDLLARKNGLVLSLVWVCSGSGPSGWVWPFLIWIWFGSDLGLIWVWFWSGLGPCESDLDLVLVKLDSNPGLFWANLGSCMVF